MPGVHSFVLRKARILVRPHATRSRNKTNGIHRRNASVPSLQGWVTKRVSLCVFGSSLNHLVSRTLQKRVWWPWKKLVFLITVSCKRLLSCSATAVVIWYREYWVFDLGSYSLELDSRTRTTTGTSVILAEKHGSRRHSTTGLARKS